MRQRKSKTSVNLEKGLAGGNECVLWQFYIQPDGYARAHYNDRKVKVHRMIWFMAGREIPQGFSLDHICHDPRYCIGGPQCLHRRCINIDHLRLATPHEQMLNSVRSRASGFCKNGHLWTEESTYINPTNKRAQCKICRSKRERVRYLKYMAERGAL